MGKTKKLPVVSIMGPTGSGKTDFAIELASKVACQLISIDSVMIYRGMDIGSAKPSSKVLAEYPHALVDIKDPSESYSVFQCIEDVCNLIDEAHQRKLLPVLVGGTMMYHYGLQFGINPLPEANQEIRNTIEKEEELYGLDYLWAKLKNIDEVYAMRIKPQDRQRIYRGIELTLLGDDIPSKLMNSSTHCIPTSQYCMTNVVMAIEDRAVLYDRLESRFDNMLACGLLDEVKKLCFSTTFNHDLPAFRAVGYRQLIQYVQGNICYSDAINDAKTATRRLAKRQLTWIKKWDKSSFFGIYDGSLVEEKATISKIIELTST